MAFHNVLFPDNISWGSRGGPGFNTQIIETDSGAEQIIPRWAEARHKYNAAWGVKNNVDLSVLKKFYMARQGCAHGFLFRDWADYTTNNVIFGLDREFSAAISPTDQFCERITDTQFQMVKRYTSAGHVRVRRILKPIEGTVRVAVDGDEILDEEGYTVNYTTGIITFTEDIPSDVFVSWGGHFYVPVRFDKEVDDLLSQTLAEFDNNSADGGVPLIEMLDPGAAYDEFYYGGGIAICLNDSYTLSIAEARVFIVDVQVAGLSLYLQEIADLPPGGPIMYIVNVGAEDIDIVKAEGGTLLTLGSGNGTTLLIGVDADDDKVWYAY